MPTLIKNRPMNSVDPSSGRRTLTDRGTIKWGDVAFAGFQVLPDALLIHQAKLGLSATDLGVLLNICSFWWARDQPPFPRPGTIAARMGLTVRTVQRSIKNLMKAKLVARVDVKRPLGQVVRALSLDGLVDALSVYVQIDPVLASRRDQYLKFMTESEKDPAERTTDKPN